MTLLAASIYARNFVYNNYDASKSINDAPSGIITLVNLFII